jgi:hypothetical protein
VLFAHRLTQSTHAPLSTGFHHHVRDQPARPRILRRAFLPDSQNSQIDAVADISLRQRGNVSATNACLEDDKCALETRLYVVFNHGDDEAARRCPQHLQVVFKIMLRQVPYEPPAVNGSPKVISDELENNFIEIRRSRPQLLIRLICASREHKLSDIRGLH